MCAFAARGQGVPPCRHSGVRRRYSVFCNTLLWVYEPRLTYRTTIPLNTWPDQDDGIVWAEECFGVRNCGIEKSRDLSWSWNCLIIAFKHWLYDDGCRTGVASLTEEKVDLADDSDSMMWKLDFMYANLPEWMRIDDKGIPILSRTYNDHRFYNRIRKNDIRGYACTMNLGRGGRKRVDHG